MQTPSFLYFCSQEELFDCKCTQIAEIRNVAKSLPPLRWNCHKQLILSYSADFSVFYKKSSNFHKIPLVNHWIFRKI